MSLLAALAVAVLFGAGVHLMIRDDAVTLAAGSLLASNAILLLLLSGGFAARVTPPASASGLDRLADPLLQALVLTAVVIGFATTVLLLRILVAVERTHQTLELDELADAEVQDAAAIERGPGDAA